MNKRKIIGIFGILLFVICLYLVVVKPLEIVGEYPKLTAFLTMLVLVISALMIVMNFITNDKQKNNSMILVSVLGGVIFILGGLMTSISFGNAKTHHLKNKGVVTVASINDKKIQSTYRKGKKSEGYELHYSFRNIDGKTIKSWEVVSEKEFYLMDQYNEIPVVYDEEKINVNELIISIEKIESYNKIINNLDKGSEEYSIVQSLIQAEKQQQLKDVYRNLGF